MLRILDDNDYRLQQKSEGQKNKTYPYEKKGYLFQAPAINDGAGSIFFQEYS